MAGSQPNIPIKGASYCKYSIRLEYDHTPNVTAASHLDKYGDEVELYINQDYITNDYWVNTNLMDEPDTGANRNFEELLAAAFNGGTAISSYPLEK
jgi:hypothetical protein